MTAPVPEHAVTAAAEAPCEHYWAFHVHDGLSVRLCQLCHEPDWADARKERQAVRGAERDRWLAVLRDHYLAGVECDPVRKLDNPVCGCSRVFLGWHPSIGAARQAWLGHVDEIARAQSGLSPGSAGAAIADAVAAERGRIRQLATEVRATYRPFDADLIRLIPGSDGQPGPDPLGDPFADLIGETP